MIDASTWRRPVPLVAVVLLSCGDAEPGAPLPLWVEPLQVGTTSPTSIVIHGQSFVPSWSFDYGRHHSRLDTAFVIKLGEVVLSSVTYRDRQRLTAAVPAGLGPGWYDLWVSDPRGKQGYLKHAVFVVGGSSCASGPSCSKGSTSVDSSVCANSCESCGAAGCCHESIDNGGDCTPCQPGCSCSFDCLGAGCNAACEEGSSCVVNAEDATFARDACKGAVCELVCLDVTHCGMSCQPGAVCEVSCNRGSSCTLDCPHDTPCLLRCQDVDTCALDCPSPTPCGGGVWVCNRACPESGAN